MARRARGAATQRRAEVARSSAGADRRAGARLVPPSPIHVSTVVLSVVCAAACMHACGATHATIAAAMARRATAADGAHAYDGGARILLDPIRARRLGPRFERSALRPHTAATSSATATAAAPVAIRDDERARCVRLEPRVSRGRHGCSRRGDGRRRLPRWPLAQAGPQVTVGGDEARRMTPALVGTRALRWQLQAVRSCAHRPRVRRVRVGFCERRTQRRSDRRADSTRNNMDAASINHVRNEASLAAFSSQAWSRTSRPRARAAARRCLSRLRIRSAQCCFK